MLTLVAAVDAYDLLDCATDIVDFVSSDVALGESR